MKLLHDLLVGSAGTKLVGCRDACKSHLSGFSGLAKQPANCFLPEPSLFLSSAMKFAYSFFILHTSQVLYFSAQHTVNLPSCGTAAASYAKSSPPAAFSQRNQSFMGYETKPCWRRASQRAQKSRAPSRQEKTGQENKTIDISLFNQCYSH